MESEPPGPMKRLAEALASTVNAFKPPKIEGFVDNVVAGEVHGWALDVRRPNRRVHVVAKAGTKIVAEALADLPRRDLIELGKGDGRFGFRLRLPSDLGPDETEHLSIEAVVRPRNVRLKRGRVSMPSAVSPSEQKSPVVSAPRWGFLERCADGVVSGWAVDPKHPDRPAKVDIFDGERFIAVVSCDRERPGLAGGKAPAGARGFALHLPPGVDVGRGEGLRARVSGSRQDLGRSRNYPGDSKKARQEPAGAPSPESDLTPSPSAAEPVSTPTAAKLGRRAWSPAPAPATAIAVVICGDAEDADLAVTRASIASQSLAPACTIRASVAEPLDPDSVRGMKAVVLISPGQTLDPHLCEILSTAGGVASCWTWPTRPQASDTPFPRVRAMLRRLDGGLALRGSVAADIAGTAPTAMLDPDAAGVEAARLGLRWGVLPGPLTSPREALNSAPPPFMEPPRRLSLAVWGDWTGELPPALAALQAGAEAMEVEVLVPARSVSEEALSVLQRSNSISSIRLVDEPEGGGDRVFRALTQAATGQVVVLARGDVELKEPRDLAQLCAWAASPGVGAVTVHLRHGEDVVGGVFIAQDDEGQKIVSARLDGAVHIAPAAPADFVILSRAALAAIGGLDAALLRDGLAMVELGRRMAAQGYATVVFAAEAVSGAPLGIEKRLSPAESARFGAASASL